VKIYKSYQEFSDIKKQSIVTIGTFDGVHIGHQEIIKKLIQNAKENNSESVILTFFPHPRMVLQKGNTIKLLNTIDEKIELLQKNGLDNLIIQAFTKEFSRLTALDFVREILVKHLHTKKLIIGYDHRFGRNREGDFIQLREYSETYNFELEEIPAQDIKDITVSSTKIRKALEDGAIEIANSYLGYHYMLTGEVVSGNALGRQYNYPTINIDIKEPYKLIPKSGVYIIETKINSEYYYGIMNIGKRPTLNGKRKTIEVHLLDFDQNLYGEKIQVGLLKFLRNEQKFDSIEQLFIQIKKDEATARELIKNGQISF
jgi:riboflavin kinase/FMN adenylyltransferase